MQASVTEKHHGVRLSSFLLGTLGISHSLLPRLKREGRILVNGTPTNVNYRLQNGDEVTVITEEAPQAEGLFSKEEGLALLHRHGISVLWEDPSLLCLIKPRGLITHPASHYQNGSLGEYVSLYLGAPFRPVSRLDVGTGGLLLAAKNAHAAARLTRLIKEGQVEKTYLALSERAPEKEKGVSLFYTKPCPRFPSRRVVCGKEEGQRCETRFLYLGERDGLHATLCRPLTGRTHQIRMTMARLGAPLLGDTAYAYLAGGEAPREREDAPTELGLFAVCLTLPHPLSGEALTFFLPDDEIPYAVPSFRHLF